MLTVTSGATPAPYPSSQTPSHATQATPFRVVLAATQSQQAADAPAVAAQSAQAATVAALGAALSQFGISVPPAIRITSGKDGFALSGDSRNDKFQAMLQANPALQNTLSGLISSETISRKAALDAVANDFAGKNPGASASAFLEDFMDAEKNDDLSLSFNGARVSVEEQGKNGWEPVKDKADFTRDLLAAYTHYLLTHQATVEKKKDDQESDADLDFRAKLAKAAQEAGAAH